MYTIHVFVRVVLLLSISCVPYRACRRRCVFAYRTQLLSPSEHCQPNVDRNRRRRLPIIIIIIINNIIFCECGVARDSRASVFVYRAYRELRARTCCAQFHPSIHRQQQRINFTAQQHSKQAQVWCTVSGSYCCLFLSFFAVYLRALQQFAACTAPQMQCNARAPRSCNNALPLQLSADRECGDLCAATAVVLRYAALRRAALRCFGQG